MKSITLPARIRSIRLPRAPDIMRDKDSFMIKWLFLSNQKKYPRTNVIIIDKDGNETNCNDQLCAEGHARPYSGGKKVPWV